MIGVAQPKLNIENLNDLIKRYLIMNGGEFTSGDINMEDIEQIWDEVKTNITESAKTVLGSHP